MSSSHPHHAQNPDLEGQSGKLAFWHSMEALNTVQEEFPKNSLNPPDMVSRRHFCKIMSASLLLAGLGASGCRRPEDYRVVPGTAPDYAAGESRYFATAMPSRRQALPLLVKSMDGRPIKVEGNPHIPGCNGGTSLHAQASILGLYDPDRAGRFTANGHPITRIEALEFLTRHGASLGRGDRVAFLTEQTNSPSRDRLREIIESKFPAAKWFEFEGVDLSFPQQGASKAFGQRVVPQWQPDKAHVLLSFDCDFLGMDDSSGRLAGLFMQNRSPSTPTDSMNRLYCVESLFTLTGSNADHRLAVPPGILTAVLARLAMEIIGDKKGLFKNLSELASSASPWESWILPCSRDLLANKGKSLILSGYRLAPEVHALIAAMNDALGNTDKTVFYQPDTTRPNGTLPQLVESLNAGSIQTLIILGGNPAYQAPVDLHWAAAQSHAQTVLYWGEYENETAQLAGVHFYPATHYLEAWGDARLADGSTLAIQPLIEPLFDGMTDLEFLARFSGLENTTPQNIVRETFQVQTNGNEIAWHEFLQSGFHKNTASTATVNSLNWNEVVKAVDTLSPGTFPSVEKLDVIFYRDLKVDDGRFINNGWLQELPDPITKLTWDNAILLSPKTAAQLGLTHTKESAPYPVAELTLGEKSLKGPVLVQPGMADNTIGLALGYGQKFSGRVGQGIGFDAFQIRSSHSPYFSTGGTIRRSAESVSLAMTQSHWNLEGNEVIRETTLQNYRKNPSFAHTPAREQFAPKTTLYPNPLDAAKTTVPHQWAMVINLNRCIGCSACVIACQSENNIPIVGREMTARSREMHWMRLDRYYTGSAESPRSVVQPMLCQHCESAPCESVCPVNATVHDAQGLNVMVYNRCVGSRYCSNNCPFKVRRFNFFDYNRNSLNRLHDSPLTTKTDGEWGLKHWLKNPDRGSLSEADFEFSKLYKNPEVTVRMRGIMEKCSFCQHRLQRARENQLIQAGNSNVTKIPADHLPQTACQQSCPTRAIEFGDATDLQSSLSKWKSNQRNYALFDTLNLIPRVTYLARICNPNPEMPDQKGVAL